MRLHALPPNTAGIASPVKRLTWRSGVKRREWCLRWCVWPRMGYHKGYQYDHDYEEGYAGQECLPEKLAGRKFYEPKGHGYEKNILERMEWLRQKKGK